jgi:hypothetical protein
MPGYLERLPVAKLLLTGATGFVGTAERQALALSEQFEVQDSFAFNWLEHC